MKKVLEIFFLMVVFSFFSTGQAFPNGAVEFYNSLEYLLDKNGNDPVQWPEGEQKRKVQTYIWLNLQKTLSDCIFGTNFLGYGVFHSPQEAKNDQMEGTRDVGGLPYDRIVASSPDGNRFLDVVRSVGTNLGVDLYNPELKKKLFIFLKADLHSQFADVFRNFNGRHFTILAREINIMGAPGSAYKGYLDDISPALASAHCREAIVWVGKKDTITRIPSKGKTTQEEGLIGLKFEFKFGAAEQKVVRIVLKDKDVDHPIKSYQRGIQEERGRPVYVITTKEGFRTLTEQSLWEAKARIGGGWQKTAEEGGWVLVGLEGKPDSGPVAILVTHPNDSPLTIAGKIRERNEREHPGKDAIVLLDGNPQSDRNKALVGALKNRGYDEEDILVVWRGDLYTTGGKLLAQGKNFLPKGAADDPVLSQGVWGHILREFTGRPVYGDPLAGSKEKKPPGGVHMDPEPQSGGKAGSKIREEVLESKPSEDSLSWPVNLPRRERK